MKSLVDNLRGFGARRLAVLGGVFVGMLALLGALFMNDTQSGANSLLYSELDPKEASLIVERLGKAHINYSLQNQGQTILVAADKVASARLLLAKDGLPSGGSIGYEIFDKTSNLTQTQFQQSINETRALEGELSRSIRLLAGVQAARVHLVLPKRELFSNEGRSAQASVLLNLAPGRQMNEESISAIANLVAAAVPGLHPQDIAIVDNHGDVLARPEGKTGNLVGFQNAEAQRLAIEQHMGQSIEGMLAVIVGEGQVRAQVSVQLDTGHMHEVQEKFDPDQQVLRSQQTTSEKHVDMKSPSNTSVANNLPNASAGSTQDGSQSSRQLESDNYEVGKTVRTLEQDQPRIARVSVSVIVDDIREIQQGKPVWKERDASQIESLTEVVKNAVGFDTRRGDSVSVVSMRFSPLSDQTLPLTETAANTLPKGRLIFSPVYGRLAGFLIFLLSVGFFVVRPLLMKRDQNSIRLAEESGAFIGGEHTDRAYLAPGSNSVANLSTNNAIVSDDTMINVDGIEGQVRAASIQKVLDFVENQPEQSIGRLRAWISSEQTELDHA